jgi:hypothetical protein
MAPAYRRAGVRVEISGDAKALPEKYQRWKVWLDEMLAMK